MDMTGLATGPGNQDQKAQSWSPVLDFLIFKCKSSNCHLLIAKLG